MSLLFLGAKAPATEPSPSGLRGLGEVSTECPAHGVMQKLTVPAASTHGREHAADAKTRQLLIGMGKSLVDLTAERARAFVTLHDDVYRLLLAGSSILPS